LQDAFATFVNIILPLHLNKLYTYRVPEELMDQMAIGKRVIVQFGAKRMYSALIHSIHHQPPKEYEAKYILNVLDDEPVIDENQLKFWEWISGYYMCSLGDVMNAALPAPFKLESKTSIRLNPSFDKNRELDDKEFLIIEALELHNEISIDEAGEVLQLKNVFPIIKSLVLKEAVLLNEEIEESYKERTASCVKLNGIYFSDIKLEKLFAQLEKREKQMNLLMAYLHLKNSHQHIVKKDLLQVAQATMAPLNTLIKNNIFTEYTIPVDRIKIEETPLQEFELNEAQQQSYTDIKKAFETKDVVLLHGVTSSGKTHIYVRLMTEALAQGKQVLFLLPEIALTSQIVNRVRKYFGAKAISFHSKFSDNERVEIWNKVKNGTYKIVIGARSSIFLPFNDLGLVIVDEEHEQTYKQQEPAPRYHARDAAIILASLHQCKTILGSATPAFETYYNSKNEKYGLVELKQRFADMEMPDIITANVAEETRVKTMRGNFTSLLYGEITNALSQSEQVILFQNRRGYAPVLECQTCHWIPKCQNCDISLTYHKYLDSLKCHYCGYTMKVPVNCHACGSHLLTFKGFGTEKIEDELKILFPEARVSRLDLDAAKSKHGHEEIIRDFEQHKFDILVGTQMLSKGLDFEKVSLVGVINADQLLYFPDFRANERAYQLLSQVSGRAGRKGRRGKVIIQTNSPNHHVIEDVIKQDYENLYQSEMAERSKYSYPPKHRIIKLVIKHKEYKTADSAAYQLVQLVGDMFGDNLIGPASPHVSKIRNYYIKEILIKIDRNNKMAGQLKFFIRQQMQKLQEQKAYRSVILFADVDTI